MKLVFPNGEHPQALLAPGINRIGSAEDGAIVLRAATMPALAAEIHLLGHFTNLIPVPGVEVVVNDRPVRERMTLRSGDRLRIAGVQVNLAAIAVDLGGAASTGDASQRVDSDAAATRMMVAAPKYLLRGLTGAHFGKLYPLAGTLTIGRAPECEIVLPQAEISRRHVQLRPTAGGVLAEDLGSSNGIWVNDERVQQRLLKPGDELRLDTHRFLVSVPGDDQVPPPRLSPAPAPAAAGRGSMLAMIAIGTGLVLVITVVAVIASQ